MIRIAPQDVNFTACLIPILVLVREQGSCSGLSDATARLIFIESTLQGPQKQVAFRVPLEYMTLSRASDSPFGALIGSPMIQHRLSDRQE